MATLFKDFDREVNDLLTKNVKAPGTWGLETKNKPLDRQIVVNPKYDSKAVSASDNGLALEVLFNDDKNKLETTTKIHSNLQVDPKVVYKGISCQRFEVSTVNAAELCPGNLTAEYQGNSNDKGAAWNLLYSQRSFKAGLTACIPNTPLQIGGTACFCLESKSISGWAVGARGNSAKHSVTGAVTLANDKVGLTAMHSHTIKDMHVKFGAAVNVACANKAVCVKAAAEFEDPFKIVDLVRVMCTNSCAVTVTVAKTVANNWTAYLTVAKGPCFNVGVSIVHEPK
jgi:hypothetical protein